MATSEAFDYPDVTLVVVNYLRDALGTVGVYTRVPESRPGSFVLVARRGGVADGPIDRARLVLECWAPDEGEAAALAGAVRDHMRRMRGAFDGYRVARTSEAGLAFLPDELTDTPRYLLTIELSAVAGTPAP